MSPTLNPRPATHKQGDDPAQLKLTMKQTSIIKNKPKTNWWDYPEDVPNAAKTFQNAKLIYGSANLKT